MTADLEKLLHEGIGQLTANAKLPPEIARRARREVARRKSRLVAATAGAAIVAVLATTLTVVLGHGAGVSKPTPTPSAAAKLLAKIATVAERQPVTQVSNSQFWYIKSWVSYSVCDGGSVNSKCVLQKPHERQIWQSVSNVCVTGLLREQGRNIPLPFSSNYLHCPSRGVMGDATYRFLQSLPTAPRKLLGQIEREMGGQQPRAQEAFTTIGDLLREKIAPPKVSAALYRAAALIPGVMIVPNAADAIGRHGIAVALSDGLVRYEWIFSKRTLLYLGERDINVSDGSISGLDAVLQRAFVNHVGQIPRKTAQLPS